MIRSKTRLLMASALLGLMACSPVIDEKPKPHIDYAAISQVLSDEVEQGIRGGFVVSIVDNDEVLYQNSIGYADVINKKPFEVTTDVRIASMSKPIVSVGIMHLVDQGKISLDDAVGKFIPAFNDQIVASNPNKNADDEYEGQKPKQPITIRHLLSHTAGIGYPFFSETDLDRDYIAANVFSTKGSLAQRIDVLAKLPLFEEPGTKWRYSYAVDILGHIAEIVSGKNLQAYLEESIFKPLGMNETRFFLSQDDFIDLAVVNGFDENGEIERYSDTALGPNPNDFPFTTMSGGAGLLSTMADYQKFTQMLLSGGQFNGHQILKPETVKLMMTPVTTAKMFEPAWPGSSFGLGGFVITDAALSPEADATGDWGWAGYWDTNVIISPANNMSVILMAQTQPGPHVPVSNAWKNVKALAYGEAK